MKKPHKRLIAWQKCMDLVEIIYEITRSFPNSEIRGLSSQMRRAATAAPSNIAEGAAGRSKPQFRRYLRIAIGSLNELDTQVEIAKRIGYLYETDSRRTTKLVDECIAVTFGLKKSLEK